MNDIENKDTIITPAAEAPEENPPKKRISEKTRTNIIKTICMLLCLSIIFGGLSYFSDSIAFTNVLYFHHTRFSGFQDEPKDTIDIVTFGTSTGRAWLPLYAWENYGITSYNLSSSAQPFCATKSLIDKMVFDDQTPKVIIVDIGSAMKDPSKISPINVRQLTESLNIFDRIPVLNDILSAAKDSPKFEDVDLASYYFPFLWEHNFYHQAFDGKSEFYYNKNSEYKGTLSFKSFLGIKEQTKQKLPKNLKPLEISDDAMAILADFIDFCDSRDDFEVLFVVMPKAGEREGKKGTSYVDEYRQVLTCVNYVEERGYKVFNFMEEKNFKKLKIDFKTDFKDERHFNVNGGMKYTDYMCRYIVENFDLPDRESDKEIKKDWDKSVDKFRKFCKKNDYEYPKKK